MGRALKILDFPSDTDQVIAATVRALASGRDQSVEHVAAACGMTKSALYERLKGTRGFKASEVALLAGHFRVGVADLYDGIGGRFGPPRGPLAQLAELRTFNPQPPSAKVLMFPPVRRRPEGELSEILAPMGAKISEGQAGIAEILVPIGPKISEGQARELLPVKSEPKKVQAA